MIFLFTNFFHKTFKTKSLQAIRSSLIKGVNFSQHSLLLWRWNKQYDYALLNQHKEHFHGQKLIPCSTALWIRAHMYFWHSLLVLNLKQKNNSKSCSSTEFRLSDSSFLLFTAPPSCLRSLQPFWLYFLLICLHTVDIGITTLIRAKQCGTIALYLSASQTCLGALC